MLLLFYCIYLLRNLSNNRALDASCCSAYCEPVASVRCIRPFVIRVAIRLNRAVNRFGGSHRTCPPENLSSGKSSSRFAFDLLLRLSSLYLFAIYSSDLIHLSVCLSSPLPTNNCPLLKLHCFSDCLSVWLSFSLCLFLL